MSDYNQINTLLDIRECCASWERKARILGNVTAGDGGDAIDYALSEIERLRARVAELEAELAEAKSHLEWACNLG